MERQAGEGARVGEEKEEWVMERGAEREKKARAERGKKTGGEGGEGDESTEKAGVTKGEGRRVDEKGASDEARGTTSQGRVVGKGRRMTACSIAGLGTR